MKKYTFEEISRLMNNQKNIRNISVIAHVDHGKSTLSDSLIAASGMMNMDQVGEKRFLDSREDEIQKGITIKSSSIALAYEINDKGTKQDLLVNLIDTPGHLDFSSEVTSALRVTDGAVVVVDCIEGVCVQTETVLRQALEDRIVPTLMINKIDRAFQELQLNSEECYQMFSRVIENVNVLISTYGKGQELIDPIKGNVSFGSGKLGFGFTLKKFANYYSKKFNVDANKLIEKLWGDHYFDKETKKWTRNPESQSGKKLKRGFCEFCIEPIQKIFEFIQKDDLKSIEDKLDIKLTDLEKKREKKELLKIVMMKFIPASECLLEMISNHLPSPIQSQAYRYKELYTGDLNDKYASSVKNCDEKGPLMVYISKMIPSTGKGRFIAFGRVFSGTLKPGMKIRVIGDDQKKEGSICTIQRLMVMMGKSGKSIDECISGNVVGILGIDKNIVKSCTLTDEKETQAFPFISMNFSVSPVVRVCVTTQNPSDLPELIEGLKKLEKSDPLIECSTDESTGQLILAGAGELHLEICIKDLEQYCNGIKIITSTPSITFNETVTSKSIECLSKSANKLNRITVSCEPLDETLVKDIENKKISFKSDLKEISKKYEFDQDIIKKIWTFGPVETGTNILVDMTKGIDYINDVKDHIIQAFQECVISGVLSGEKMRGIRFNILDLSIHSDPSHRGARQFIPASKRAFYASQLTASPRLIEPIFKVDIQTSEECIGSCYSVINKRKGEIIGEEAREGTPLRILSCYLPVIESFGLTESLRSSTSGKALPQCSFDHWSIMKNDPLEDEKMKKLIEEIRKRKGMKEVEVPPLSRFLDKL